MLGCAHARAPGHARAAPRGARGRRRRERPQRRLRAPRRAQRATTRPASGSARRPRGLWQLTERTLDAMAELAGDALRRVGSLRLAGGREEREALRAEFEALREDGFEAEWLDPLPGPLARRFAGRAPAPGRRGAPPARWVRRLAAPRPRPGVEIVEGSAGRGAGRARGRRRSSSRPTGYRRPALPELAARSCPCAARCSPRSRCRSASTRAALRPARLRLLAAAPDGRLIVGGRRDASIETEAPTTRRRRRRSRRSSRPRRRRCSAACRASRTAGPASGAGRRTCCRSRAACRADERLWVAGGYSGHGNVLGFACGELVAQAIARRAAPRARALRPGAARRLELERGRSSSSARSSAAIAIARSWIASPVESKIVISSAERRPSASPASTAPELGHVARVDAPASTACASSPPWLACSQSSQKMRRARARSLRSPPCPARRRPSGSRAGPAAASLRGAAPRARRDRHEEVGGERLLARRRDAERRARPRRPAARSASTSQTPRRGRARGTSARRRGR